MSAQELFDDGNRLFRDELYWAALLRYEQAGEAGMETPLLHYNTGVAHYRAGQYERAREALLKAVTAPGLRNVAGYNLGLTAWKLGDTDEALRWLRVARDQQQNPAIADYAAEALARIAAGQAQSDPVELHAEVERQKREFAHLDLRATIGFGNDNNVFRSPDTPYIDYSDPLLPEVVPQPVSGAYIPVAIRAKYQVNAYSNEGFFGAYRLVGRYYQDEELENANEYAHEVSFGSAYRRKNEEKNRERSVFSAFTVAQHDKVWYDTDDGSSHIVDDESADDRMNYLRYGPQLEFRQAHKKLSFGMDITGELWNYENTEVVPEYDHEYFTFGAFTQYKFTPTSLLEVTARKSSRRFGDRPSYNADGEQLVNNPAVRYDYLDIGLGARQRITRGIWAGFGYERSERIDRFEGYYDYTRDQYSADFHWQIGHRVDIDLYAAYQLYNYPQAFAFNNPLLPRKTLEHLDYGLSANFRVTEHLYVVLDAKVFESASNDARLTYDRANYALGIRWSQ